MSPKQEAFVREYLVDLNATAAARRAGYSEKTAKEIGAENLTKPPIRDAIAAAQQKRSDRTEITQDRVLQELARIAFFDIRKLYREDGTMKAPHELDDDAAAVLAGLDITEEFGTDEPTEEMEGQAHGGALRRRRAVIGYTKKAKVVDKSAALALAMRHLGMLNDKMQLNGSVTIQAAKEDEGL